MVYLLYFLQNIINVDHDSRFITILNIVLSSCIVWVTTSIIKLDRSLKPWIQYRLLKSIKIYVSIIEILMY